MSRHHEDGSTDSRIISLLLLGLVVLFGGLYVAGYVFTGDKVPRGTTVAGIDIGGLRPAAARATLREELRPRAERPVVVTADGRRTRLRPDEAGLSVDYAASVEQAGAGRSWNPARMWDYFTGGDRLDAVTVVDDTEIAESLEPLARKLERPAVEGTVVFRDGTARAKLPKEGRHLDLEQAAAEVAAAYLTGTEDGGRTTVRLEVSEVEPEVTETEVHRAMNRFANPAVSGPVTFALAGERAEIPPTRFTRALSMAVEDGELVPRVDARKLEAAIRPELRGLVRRPRPATVRLVNGRPKVIPGRNGVSFRAKEAASEFLDAVDNERNRVVRLKSVVARPAFTTKDARNLGIREVVSRFTTYFPHSDYRNTNLGRAAELINGTVLEPGETFSLNETVGERTAANGFTKGYIISDGVYREEYGGGVSQVATTLFNAAFFAGLEDVEHKPHSFYIDRYPLGREATVVWGAVDLKFKNDTPHGILIQTWIEPSTPYEQGEMHVRFWSTKYWDISASVSERYDFVEEETRYIDDPDCVPNDGYAGFEVDVYRIFRKPGSDEVVRRERMHTTYTPSDTVICGKPPRSG